MTNQELNNIEALAIATAKLENQEITAKIKKLVAIRREVCSSIRDLHAKEYRAGKRVAPAKIHNIKAKINSLYTERSRISCLISELTLYLSDLEEITAEVKGIANQQDLQSFKFHKFISDSPCDGLTRGNHLT